jgi:hypothetical protein
MPLESFSHNGIGFELRLIRFKNVMRSRFYEHFISRLLLLDYFSFVQWQIHGEGIQPGSSEIAS